MALEATMGNVVGGGFVRPVFDAQATFRAVMDAMARPGTVHALGADARPPAPLGAEAAAVALALVDHDTPLWLDPVLAGSDEVRAWLGFHTGAPLTRVAGEAHFAIVSDAASLIAFENFAQGSQDYPDRSATLILDVAAFEGGEGLILSGPGIETTATLSPKRMPRHFVEQWKQNRARFPRGVDLILTAGGAVACLPRTTRVTVSGG